MRKNRRFTYVLALSSALALTAPVTAQVTGVNSGLVQRIPGAGGIETQIIRGLAIADVRPEARTLRLTIPEGAELVAVERQEDDYNLAIGLRLGADTEEVFEYYRRLMAAQGFQLVSADYGVTGRGLFGDQLDSEHIQAVFVRNPGAAAVPVRQGIYQRGPVDTKAGDRVDMLIDREGPYSYVVYAEPQAYAGRNGVFDSPLYQDGPRGRQAGAGAGQTGAAASQATQPLGYGFYGPIGFRGFRGLQPDPTRIRFAAPEGVTAFQLDQTDPDRFVYRYKLRGGLQEVAGFYNRILGLQDFERVGGSLGQRGGELIYGNGDRRVLVAINRVGEGTGLGEGVYETVIDLQPEAGVEAE